MVIYSCEKCGKQFNQKRVRKIEVLNACRDTSLIRAAGVSFHRSLADPDVELDPDPFLHQRAAPVYEQEGEQKQRIGHEGDHGLRRSTPGQELTGVPHDIIPHEHRDGITDELADHESGQYAQGVHAGDARRDEQGRAGDGHQGVEQGEHL